MCGCPEMASYEEFCLRSLAILQEEGKFKKTTCEPLWSPKAFSLIRFHGRAVLSPLLSAEQRSEMCDQRQRAVQLEVDRQNKLRKNIMARVQDILEQPRAHGESSIDDEKPPVSKSAKESGYTLITDSPGLPRDPGFGLQTRDQPSSETPIVNGYNLDSLLKRSREYVKREQCQQGSEVVATVTGTPLLETVSDKENKSRSPMGNTGVEFGFSLHHSPSGPPRTQIQHQYLYDASPQQLVVSHLFYMTGMLGSPVQSPALVPVHRDAGHVQFLQGTYTFRFPSARQTLSPVAHGAGFRRRCHTFDSQLHSKHSVVEHIGRSQERVPRFMAGVTWMAASGRTPTAPLNRSFEDTNNGRIIPTVLRNAAEAQTSKTEETQRRAQALEDMQRRLEEEHALQMSLLLAEQEKEQQRLCLELEETEKRLMEQGCVRPLGEEACGWNCRSVSDSRPIVRPSCPGLSPAHTPSERSPGHSIGFSSPVGSSLSSPSLQSPVYLWGSTWAGSKPRARLSLVLSAEQQRAFCRIGAIIRGFLTRRLLKTEKIKHLCQTIMDTQEFIRSFQTEAHQKKGPCSAQDRSLQERVRAQLRAALYDIHDIFFEIPLGDRLALLQQDRELRAERKLRDMEKAKCPKDRAVLSAATQRSLDRKKRVSESPAQARKMQQKPKSPTTNRVLKPSQGQNSPVAGQLNRQGSWYRKTPGERVRRSDSLKKQHSLG
ncbi:Centriolar coiled-coil protein of 110 kDa [Dissostichus eleginoides]|uniref:Centriolar coiled-coil protein of 110 kDa n=1 Tax=Dissostichus eleginoides TaxID=100907 RepID=A0AAD9B5Q3_DISEL|nr:Centriolar coiled-coil protein of 110 kDa [Dissostichus eleginoides]